MFWSYVVFQALIYLWICLHFCPLERSGEPAVEKGRLRWVCTGWPLATDTCVSRVLTQTRSDIPSTVKVSLDSVFLISSRMHPPPTEASPSAFCQWHSSWQLVAFYRRRIAAWNPAPWFKSMQCDGGGLSFRDVILLSHRGRFNTAGGDNCSWISWHHLK